MCLLSDTHTHKKKSSVKCIEMKYEKQTLASKSLSSNWKGERDVGVVEEGSCAKVRSSL